jgi:hypothetical protein
MRQNLRPSDVVLVHIQDKPAFYAQIQAIEPDVKKGWYRVTLCSLFGELQWVLEDIHVFLGQTWTFRGIPHRINRIGKREKSGPPSRQTRLRRVK